ncbi:MAG: ribonuclease H-like domain-containing protein [Planctomycetes bacterium]|nr:ribonuclease H-like domain-containing protein [Planctomycetota bacterium]
MRLYLDIETLPVPPERVDVFLSTVKPPCASEEERREAIAQTSLHAEFGRILCIGIWREPGMDGPEILAGPEADMLRRFWQQARGVRQYVGHNILSFDLPFLIKRSIVHGIPPLPISLARYRSDQVYDTMEMWNFWSSRERISLDTLAKVLGLKSSKGEINGGCVAKVHAAGRDAEIYAYCMQDVRLTREIYKRMTFEP